MNIHLFFSSTGNELLYLQTVTTLNFGVSEEVKQVSSRGFNCVIFCDS